MHVTDCTSNFCAKKKRYTKTVKLLLFYARCCYQQAMVFLFIFTMISIFIYVVCWKQRVLGQGTSHSSKNRMLLRWEIQRLLVKLRHKHSNRIGKTALVHLYYVSYIIIYNIFIRIWHKSSFSLMLC